MTAVAQPRPAVSITDPQHVHTRTCYWDCREARWECPQQSAAATTATAESDTGAELQP